MNSNEYWPAIQAGDLQEIRRLAAAGVPLSEPDRSRSDLLTPLHFAASIPAAAPAGVLVDLGADLEAKGAHGETPLLHAVLNSGRDSGACAVLLLERGADAWAANTIGISPLYAADDLMDPAPIMADAFERAAADRRASLNRDPDAPLIAAATTGSVSDIEQAAASAADIEIRDRDGRTALALVALRAIEADWNRDGLDLLIVDDAVRAVRALRGAGASALAPSDSGASALAIAEDFEAPGPVLEQLRAAP